MYAPHEYKCNNMTYVSVNTANSEFDKNLFESKILTLETGSFYENNTSKVHSKF